MYRTCKMIYTVRTRNLTHCLLIPIQVWATLAHALLLQAVGGDSPMPEAAQGAAESDEDMGRELFGDDQAEASGREDRVAAEAPAAAALAEPPAQSDAVRAIPVACTDELVFSLSPWSACFEGENKQAPAG